MATATFAQNGGVNDEGVEAVLGASNSWEQSVGPFLQPTGPTSFLRRVTIEHRTTSKNPSLWVT